MKSLFLGVLAISALVAGDLIVKEIPRDYEVSKSLGPYSQQFVYLRGDPAYDATPTSDVQLLENVVGRNVLASVIENALNDFRDVVINGNDQFPPLDPLKLETVGPMEFTVTGVRARAGVSNFRAEGLRWYTVDRVTFNAVRLAVGVQLTLPWLNLFGTYDTEVRLALLLTHRAGGNFRIFVNRFELGADLRLGTNLIGGHLILRELNINIDIHDTLIQVDGMTGSPIINSFISSYIQNLTQDIVQTHMVTVSQMISEELFDTVNDFLKDYTISDILG